MNMQITFWLLIISWPLNQCVFIGFTSKSRNEMMPNDKWMPYIASLLLQINIGDLTSFICFSFQKHVKHCCNKKYRIHFASRLIYLDWSVCAWRHKKSCFKIDFSNGNVDVNRCEFSMNLMRGTFRHLFCAFQLCISATGSLSFLHSSPWH